MGRAEPQASLLWTEVGMKHRCSLNKTLLLRVHSKVAEIQLALHGNFTSKFLKREDNSRDLMGLYWQNDRANGRFLQSIGYQFPCAALLKLWGIRENKECRLCKRQHPRDTAWPESLGHTFKPNTQTYETPG